MLDASVNRVLWYLISISSRRIQGQCDVPVSGVCKTLSCSFFSASLAEISEVLCWTCLLASTSFRAMIDELEVDTDLLQREVRCRVELFKYSMIAL